MPIESGTVIVDLDSLWPLGGDAISQGDDHVRLVKAILKSQFPGAGGLGFAIPITATEAEINNLTGVTGDIQVQLDLKYDKVGGLITGDVIVDKASADAAFLAVRNDEGGLVLSADTGGATLSVTQADGTSPIIGVLIDEDGAVTVGYGGAERLKTSTTGGALSNIWTAPTASPGTNTTQLATTAFVQAAINSSTTANTATGRYIILPDGLMIQWETISDNVSSGTWTFPLPFAAIIYAKGLTPASSQNLGSITSIRQTAGSTNASIDWFKTTADTIDLFAIGY